MQFFNTTDHDRFPCNQFGAQEPGTNEEIADFCTKNFGVTFKLFDKVDVNGNNTSPVYKFLKEKTGVNAISWNFEVYHRMDLLIDRNSWLIRMEMLLVTSNLVWLLKSSKKRSRSFCDYLPSFERFQ